jgi:hypothetical protein
MRSGSPNFGPMVLFEIHSERNQLEDQLWELLSEI